MVSYLLIVENDLWKTFKVVAQMQGLHIYEALPQAMLEYVQSHETEQIQVNIQVIENSKKDLLTFVYEEEIKNKVSELLDAKKRQAPLHYTKSLKKEILDLVRKHPSLSKPLAEEIVLAFKQLAIKEG